MTCNFSISAPAEQYRRHLKVNDRSVQKVFGSLRKTFDHLPAICHVFRDTPNAEDDEKTFEGRYVYTLSDMYDSNAIVCTIVYDGLYTCTILMYF